jgi:hypothetical protein
MRMIKAVVGVLTGWLGVKRSAKRPAWAVRVTVHEHADQIRDVLARAGQPVGEGQEVRAQLLRLPGDELQDLGQPPKHGQLTGAPVLGAFVALAAQLLEEGERPFLRPVHAEVAHARLAHHLASRHRAHHRVARVASRPQRWQDGLDVLFDEEHVGENDIAFRNVGAARFDGFRVTEIGQRVKAHVEPRHVGRQLGSRPVERPRNGGVQREDDDLHGRHLSS